MRARVNAAQDILDSMHYRQRGVIVPTPYGHCQVLLFRENDEMVIVQLPFGKPRARMWSLLVIGVIYIVFFFIPSPVWAATCRCGTPCRGPAKRSERPQCRTSTGAATTR